MPSRRLREIGSPRLVAYGDSMFGRITILVRQNPAAKLAGEHRVPRWYVTVADRALDMLAVVRLARRLSTGHEPDEFASGTCRAYSWLAASPQRHSAQIPERAGEFHGIISTSPARFSGLASVSVSRCHCRH